MAPLPLTHRSLPLFHEIRQRLLGELGPWIDCLGADSTPGAYLVVGRSGGLEFSSFVLVSALKIRVQQRSGRIYVYAFSGGKPAGGVKVRIAAAGRILARGVTDARGLFSHADRGASAVVAFSERNYALWSK